MDEIDDDDGCDYSQPGRPTDLEFDFEDYFKRSANRELSDEEADEFTMRAMALFCRDFWKKEDPADVPLWLMRYFAEQFYNVLAGEPFNQALPLPWDQADLLGHLSRKERQEREIFMDIAKLLASCPDIKVTRAMQEVADARHVSYETARAAWYKIKSGKHLTLLKKDSKI